MFSKIYGYFWRFSLTVTGKVAKCTTVSQHDFQSRRLQVAIHTKFAFSRPEKFSLNMLLDFRPSSQRRAIARHALARSMQVIEACDKSNVPIKVRCDVFFLNISTIYKLQLYISSNEQYNNTKYIKIILPI
jgi:hypothetical protein